MSTDKNIRKLGYVDFAPSSNPLPGEWTVSRARGKRFTVDWASPTAQCSPLTINALTEAIVIFPGSSGHIKHSIQGSVEVEERSIALVPQGRFAIEASGPVAIIMPFEGNAPAGAVNDYEYGPDDEGIRALPTLTPDHAGLRVIRADEIHAPTEKPRLKILRGAALSVTWVEYTGQRDRTRLSPHVHDDFEQGSLALAGDFIHHLRTPWSANADDWLEDRHLQASSPSLCVIPPKVIHTTEGIGVGRHLLIDIFAPPRADFLEKGWVFNASDFDS